MPEHSAALRDLLALFRRELPAHIGVRLYDGTTLNARTIWRNAGRRTWSEWGNYQLELNSLFVGGEFTDNNLSQRWQGQLNSVPHQPGRDILVIVTVDVPGAGHVLPRDRWVARLQLIRQAARCL